MVKKIEDVAPIWCMKETKKLCRDTAKCKPMDAMERLDVELANSELED